MTVANTRTKYDTDIVAWANEQAALMRAGRFDELDIEHISDEVEDVGKSEQREFMSHMVVLLSHLLKWKFQPERRGASWEKTIKAQRLEIALNIKDSPSLKSKIADDEWQEVVWAKAIAQAVSETDLDVFPDSNPWSDQQIMDVNFFPDATNPPRPV